MQLSIDCYGCMIKQSLLLARNATPDLDLQRDIVKKACSIIESSPVENFPSYLQIELEDYVRKNIADKDFYKEEKQDSIELIQKAMPYIQMYLEEQNYSIEALIKVAIIGNHMDTGVYGKNIVFNKETVTELLEMPYGYSDMEILTDKLRSAKKLLVVADNVGEHLLDKLLLEHLNDKMEVTYAVRGGMILNDITMDYAINDGLDKVSRLITTGTKHAGVVPAESSDEFMQAFMDADVVICKGMGNYETSELYPRDVFCIFKAKCVTVATKAEVNLGDLVIKHIVSQVK